MRGTHRRLSQHTRALIFDKCQFENLFKMTQWITNQWLKKRFTNVSVFVFVTMSVSIGQIHVQWTQCPFCLELSVHGPFCHCNKKEVIWFIIKEPIEKLDWLVDNQSHGKWSRQTVTIIFLSRDDLKSFACKPNVKIKQSQTKQGRNTPRQFDSSIEDNKNDVSTVSMTLKTQCQWIMTRSFSKWSTPGASEMFFVAALFQHSDDNAWIQEKTRHSFWGTHVSRTTCCSLLQDRDQFCQNNTNQSSFGLQCTLSFFLHKEHLDSSCAATCMFWTHTKWFCVAFLLVFACHCHKCCLTDPHISGQHDVLKTPSFHAVSCRPACSPLVQHQSTNAAIWWSVKRTATLTQGLLVWCGVSKHSQGCSSVHASMKKDQIKHNKTF